MGSAVCGLTSGLRYFKRGVSLFVSTCLAVGLVPVAAFGSTSVGVKVELPEQISQTEQLVPVEQDAAEAGEVKPSKKDPKTADAALPDTSGSSDQASIRPESIPKCVTADVQLAQASTILQDGLEYTVGPGTKSATLVGWYGSAPQGDIVVPSTVHDGATSYKVEIVWGGAIS